ncbi:DUF1501 domain-containing protein [Parvularcula lutaonensis]|uniref:DUF1501 domain-containing protein n=1 Tax=Parvularcula lutaonensis TaxID=491923 RepID=A0ABV7MDF2_9PROT|nr:DUF1501 domain-containing protein [Parvularcula lutaonensis]GGY39729.1 Tat pathway signal protein [Parvularcula lutaonensis]
MTTRRDFLRTSLAGGIAVTSMSLPAAAQAQTPGYKALVCILLDGGMDSFDCLVPNTTNDYNRWSGYRQSMLKGYDPGQRDMSSLHALTTAGSPNLGFVPEMADMATLYNEGSMAIVSNVGPLVQPTTAAQVAAGTAQLPPRLESHNDQLAIWQTMAPDGQATGWAGRFIDQFGDLDPLARITVGRPAPMAPSDLSPGITLSRGSLTLPLGMGESRIYGSPWLPSQFERHYRGQNRSYSNILMQEVLNAQNRALDGSISLQDALAIQTAGGAVARPGNDLSNDLAMVADVIAHHQQTGVSRQVFCVQMYGFDTHANQADRLPPLQAELSEALLSFHRGMEAIGMENDVTTFTVSDFGRTLVGNSNGTDHGWGGMSFVVGGAVNGGRFVGNVPPYSTGHGQDWRRGALIPETSIEQFGSALGSWFGVDNAGLDNVFPNRGRFDMNATQIF